MALFGRDGRWLEVNDELCRITGYSQRELKATTLWAMTRDEDVELDAQPQRDLLSGRIRSYRLEKRYRDRQGHELWVLVTVSLVRDAQGQPLFMIAQVQDVSDRKKQEERLEYLVDHDFLTGLFNRRRFEQELTKETRRVARYGLSGAVILIDLDKFKNVNDALGHPVGDDLLKKVAAALNHRMRQTDVLARVGGDEFAVLLPQTRDGQAQIAAEGIVETVRQYGTVSGEESIGVTASVGVASIDGLSPREMMRRADAAMYEAKRAGRDRFAVYRKAPGALTTSKPAPATSSSNRP